ncbi:MAG: VOC family protein [Sulfobacillus sp.]
MVLDHIDLRVCDLQRARVFYRAWLPLLGLSEGEGDGDWVEFSSPDRLGPFFGLNQDRSHHPGHSRIAFGAVSQAAVDTASAAADRAGAVGMEGPALCPDYSPTYYAAFFADPDGNLLEICHRGDR